MKYAIAALCIFRAWLARKLKFPENVVLDWEDEASLRMFNCSLDFQSVDVTGKKDSA